ncbi:MAG: (Fe-S)-binding protein [Deltaproteobacteria bacterium]|nr:(Fe-S)-binding protein [Deltaproteobacteria bacterium]
MPDPRRPSPEAQLAPFVRELEYCTYCPKLCRHACPVATSLGSETLVPQAKMELLNLMRRNAIPWTTDHALPLYGCTGCGLCREYCEHDNDVATALFFGRAVARDRGLEHPAVERLPERFRTRNEALRARLHALVPPQRLAKEARVGFLPACDSVDSSPGDVASALDLFDRLDLGFVRVVDTPVICAGYPLWAAGHVEAGRFVAEELLRRLRGFNTVVLGCPACVHLLRVRLPGEGLEHNVEVLHLSEYLALHLPRVEVKRRQPSAYYHDPCYLGRHLGVYDQPRALVARCVESPREFLHARELAECCGGGGLVPLTYPEVAREQARRRLAEPELLAVPRVVTSCGTCKRTLEAAGTGVEIWDLARLLDWATAPEPPSPPSPRAPGTRKRKTRITR